MLPRENRLKKKKDFEKVFKKGKAKKGKFFLIKFIKNELKTIRIGFVVSKKISNKATKRNKLKRRMREATKMFLPSLPLGMDIVIVALRGSENLDFDQIRNHLEDLLNQIK